MLSGCFLSTRAVTKGVRFDAARLLKDWRPCQSIAPTEASHERLGMLRRRILGPSRLLGLNRSTLWQGGIMHNTCLHVLNRLRRPGRYLRTFLSRPGLKLIEQGFGSWRIGFGLVLKARFKGGKQFIGRWGLRQGLSAGG